MDNYTLWTKHGEPGVVMQDGEGDDDDNIADWAHLHEARAFEDEPMDDAEEMDEAGEDCIQIASRGLKSWVPHLKCYSGRQLMVSPIRSYLES